MTRREFKALRDKHYKLVGELGTLAEKYERSTGIDPHSRSIDLALSTGYARGCEMLDEIDRLGYLLGYLDEFNNETAA